MDRRDILLEVSELCQESLDFIQSQLIYYRASVYKQESADVIHSEIDTLEAISSLLPLDPMGEGIRDYHAEIQTGQPPPFPGECQFSARIVRLLERLRMDLLNNQRNDQTKKPEKIQEQESLSRKLGESKRSVLSKARPGSRVWSFFQNY